MVTRCSKLPIAICINQFKETATDILLIIHLGHGEFVVEAIPLRSISRCHEKIQKIADQ